MRKPKQAAVRQRSPEELGELAEIAVYKGSAEHKSQKWWCGLPARLPVRDGQFVRYGKQTTTICPLTRPEDRGRATEWLRYAIRTGQCKFHETDKIFPKKVWHEADGRIWMGLLINPGNGQYKGWPITKEERDAVFN